MEEDGFVLVKQRNKKYSRDRKYKPVASKLKEPLDTCQLSPATTVPEVTVSEASRVHQRVLTCKSEIISHPVWTSLREVLGDLQINEIICYGLGSMFVGHCTFASRHQLALLLALCEAFAVPATAYDPVFCSYDLDLLRSFNVSILSQNDNAKYLALGRTLFFMPRCPFELFNNLLWRNWNDLSNIILLGNNLTFLETQLPSSEFQTNFYFIKKVLASMDTHRLCVDNSPLDDVMNNTAIHTFSSTAELRISDSEQADLEPK